MLKINNIVYTMAEVINLYPDKWVVFENAVLDDGGFIQSGELIAVGNQKEIDAFIVDCYNSNKVIAYERTSDTKGVGIVNVEGIEIEVKSE